MPRTRETSTVTPHWHLDCRLVAELPEDRIIGTRFLVNAPFASAALASILFAAWQGYRDVTLRHQIVDWERRIADTSVARHDVERMEAEYAAEAAKIDGAYATIRTPIMISEFVGTVGRTLPARMVVDLIEWGDNGVVVRGTLRETSERASLLLGRYVKQLHDDPTIGPSFKSIVLSGLERGKDDGLAFEITFHLRDR